MISRRGFFAYLAFFLSSATCLVVSSAGASTTTLAPGVLALSDENFEHTTQASTGQTTGSWLVYFHSDDKTAAVSGDYPDESEWLEEHVVVASVNVEKGGKSTFERFFQDQHQQLPAFVFIHKGKVYDYPKPAEGYSWDALMDFCRKPNAAVARDIPAPPSFMHGILAKIESDKTYMIAIGGMILIVVMGRIFGALGGHSTEQQKKKDK